VNSGMRAAPLLRGGAVAVAAIAAVLLIAHPAAAQIPELRAGAGVRYEVYSFRAPEDVDLDHIALVTIPLRAGVALARQLELEVSGAFASAEARRADGRDLALSGLTDTELRLTTALARDRVRLGLVALLPTGQTELSADEMDVAGIIAADLLPFAVSHWGSGGGIGMSAAVASPLGYEMSVGLSAGYVVAREFEPVAEESFAYRPGNQLHVRAGLDRNFGRAGKASLQLAYQQYGRDRAAGANLYQTGDRLQVVGSYAFPARAVGNGIVYAGYLRRQGGHFTEVVRFTPAQDLLYAGGGLRLPYQGMILLPSVDARILGNEAGLDQGYTVSSGIGAEIPAGRVLIVPAARFRVGSLTARAGLRSGFSGLDLGLALRAGRRSP
jgi:hypothetical protein